MPKAQSAASPAPEGTEGMAFETALAQLEAIVQRLESGEVDLEESIQIYEQGVKLKQFCEHKLSEAQARVDKIVLGPGGEPGLEPADKS